MYIIIVEFIQSNIKRKNYNYTNKGYFYRLWIHYILLIMKQHRIIKKKKLQQCNISSKYSLQKSRVRNKTVFENK